MVAESEEEFFEDFSGYEITDDDLDEVLIEARRNGDVRLRRAMKELQFFRFLFRNLNEQSENGQDISAFIEMGKRALKSKK